MKEDNYYNDKKKKIRLSKVKYAGMPAEKLSAPAHVYYPKHTHHPRNHTYAQANTDGKESKDR